MLRTEETQNRIRQVAFQQVSRPSFPVSQQMIETLHFSGFAITLEQFARSWWCPCARVQHRDIYFAPREGLIEYRQVADHHGEKGNAGAGLDYGYCSAGRTGMGDVSKAKDEEGGATEIKRLTNSVNRRRLSKLAHGPVNQSKAEHNGQRPHREEHDQ